MGKIDFDSIVFIKDTKVYFYATDLRIEKDERGTGIGGFFLLCSYVESRWVNI